MSISPILDIVADLRAGKMVILVDEEDRENEGDLVMAVEHVTPEAINFMVTHARGLVCLTLTEERCRQLGLWQMARDNKSPHTTAFTVSIEAAEGVTTGISAHDRARTIRVAVAADAKPEDVVQPGHVFPIMARPGGVLVRAGHTEAGCDLAQMAGRTGLLEPGHAHDPLVVATVVAARAGFGDALCLILLCHLRIMLTEMSSVIVYDPCTPIKRIGIEILVIAVEAVEFHHMTRAALLVGDLFQIEIDALVLLVAGRARESACGHVMGREGDCLRARRWRLRQTRGTFHKSLSAPFEYVAWRAVRIESRFRHFVAGEAGLAVSERISADEAVNPTQFAAAALGVAGRASLDCAMGTRERPRHQELRALRDKEDRAEAKEGRQPQMPGKTVAPWFSLRLPFRLRRPNRCDPSRPPHHQAPDEKA